MKTKAIPLRPRSDATHAAPRGARTDRTPRAAQRTRIARQPTMCERCGAVYERKTWRAGERTQRTSLVDVGWTLCPACVQMDEGEFFGRVRVLGVLDPDLEAQVRRRIWNVEARARYTQPERRTVRIDRTKAGLEILTTSQKLAHRITRELVKAFGGGEHYAWSDAEGMLDATWSPIRGLAAGGAVPRRRRGA